MGFMDWLHKIYQTETGGNRGQEDMATLQRIYDTHNLANQDEFTNTASVPYQTIDRIAAERGYKNVPGAGFAYYPKDADELTVARSLRKGTHTMTGDNLNPSDIVRLQTTPMIRKGK